VKQGVAWLSRRRHFNVGRRHTESPNRSLVFKEGVTAMSATYHIGHKRKRRHPVGYHSGHKVGQIPTQWKYAIKTSVYKGGCSSDVKNYRPVLRTSVASKLMEHVIVVDVLYYVKSQKLTSPQQHGFLGRRSSLQYLTC